MKEDCTRWPEPDEKDADSENATFDSCSNTKAFAVYDPRKVADDTDNLMPVIGTVGDIQELQEPVLSVQNGDSQEIVSNIAVCNPTLPTISKG